MSCGLVGIDLVTQLPLFPTDDQLKVQQNGRKFRTQEYLRLSFFQLSNGSVH